MKYRQRMDRTRPQRLQLQRADREPGRLCLRLHLGLGRLLLHLHNPLLPCRIRRQEGQDVRDVREETGWHVRSQQAQFEVERQLC